MDEAYNKRLSRSCYYVCLGLWIIGLTVYGILQALGISITKLSLYPCVMLTLSGMYCPGCGGTRAVECLLEGRLLQSLIYHPLVPYTAVLTICCIFSHTLNLLTRGKVRAMRFRAIYLYVMLIILVVQWIGKNVLKLAFFIELC